MGREKKSHKLLNVDGRIFVSAAASETKTISDFKLHLNDNIYLICYSGTYSQPGNQSWNFAS